MKKNKEKLQKQLTEWEIYQILEELQWETYCVLQGQRERIRNSYERILKYSENNH